MAGRGAEMGGGWPRGGGLRCLCGGFRGGGVRGGAVVAWMVAALALLAAVELPAAAVAAGPGSASSCVKLGSSTLVPQSCPMYCMSQ